jgi:hypothetical protein
MSKKKHFKELDDTERLEQKIRDLKSTNKALLRQLKKVSKGYKRYLLEEDEEEKKQVIETVAKKICFSCSIGEYKEIIVANRRWRQCDSCGKRGKVTILEEEK